MEPGPVTPLLPDQRAEGIDPGAAAEEGATDAPLRRVSKALYLNAMRELTGVSVPAALHPPDDSNTHGFLNAIAGLEISPLQLDAYEAAAEYVIDELLRRPGASRFDGEAVPPSETLIPDPDGVIRFPPNTDRWLGELAFPERGTYTLTFNVVFEPIGPGDTLPIVIRVDGESVFTAEREVGRNDPPELLTYTAEAVIDRGPHTIVFEWLPSTSQFVMVRTGVEHVAVTGPALPEANPQRDALVDCALDEAPTTCIPAIVERVAGRAFRRPLTAEELERIVALPLAMLEEGRTPDEALGAGLRTVLLHPRFLFAMEAHAVGTRPLDAWELAARLAATVWVSLPDATLRARAADGTLTQDAVLRAEVRRMLADPRAKALADHFVMDWLDLERVEGMRPDPFTYPSFDESLREGMLLEVSSLARSLVGKGRPLTALLLSETANASARLRTHYGIRLSGSGEVDVASLGRVGILGAGAFLTMNSGSDRSSPTRRGVWILDKLLCDPPDPPPPGVPSLPETGTNQERLEAHASNPVCAGCHIEIDGLGKTLENFDGVGAWRTQEESQPIDPSGVLPDGTAIEGLVDLATGLAASPAFTRCASENLFTWAMGRRVGSDGDAIDAVDNALRTEAGTLEAAVEALVMSEAFRRHRGVPRD